MAHNNDARNRQAAEAFFPKARPADPQQAANLAALETTTAMLETQNALLKLRAPAAALPTQLTAALKDLEQLTKLATELCRGLLEMKEAARHEINSTIQAGREEMAREAGRHRPRSKTVHITQRDPRGQILTAEIL